MCLGNHLGEVMVRRRQTAVHFIDEHDVEMRSIGKG
jgi:hypothetical protein